VSITKNLFEILGQPRVLGRHERRGISVVARATCAPDAVHVVLDLPGKGCSAEGGGRGEGERGEGCRGRRNRATALSARASGERVNERKNKNSNGEANAHRHSGRVRAKSVKVFFHEK
jgi:hypothetical protein